MEMDVDLSSLPSFKKAYLFLEDCGMHKVITIEIYIYY